MTQKPQIGKSIYMREVARGMFTPCTRGWPDDILIKLDYIEVHSLHAGMARVRLATRINTPNTPPQGDGPISPFSTLNATSCAPL